MHPVGVESGDSDKAKGKSHGRAVRRTPRGGPDEGPGMEPCLVNMRRATEPNVASWQPPVGGGTLFRPQDYGEGLVICHKGEVVPIKLLVKLVYSKYQGKGFFFQL